MWSGDLSARGVDRSLLLVLRADGLDAGWAPASGAGGGTAWRTASLPVQPASHVESDATMARDHDATHSATRVAVVAAFASMRAVLLDPESGPGRSPPRLFTVLLGGPSMGLLALPWSDALLAGQGRAHLEGQFTAHGFDVQPADLLGVDTGPPPGQPRMAFWVPGWLAQEVGALAAAMGARVASVQALNAVAAGWSLRQQRQLPAGRAVAVMGSGSMQFVDGRGLGEILADAPGDVALATRAASLWQRARVRFPALATSPGLRLLSLDEAPPTPTTAALSSVVGAASVAANIHWLPWPGGDRSRPALDRSLMQEARARPTVEIWPAEPRRRTAYVWPALALACLVAAAGLSVAAVQRHEEARQLEDHAAAPAPQPRSPPPSRAEVVEVRAVNAAIRQINVSLPALLRTLQPPKDIHVALVSLDLAGVGSDSDSGGAIKLVAEAPSGRDMTHYVGFLGARPGVQNVQLVRHDVDPVRPGAYRFDVELTWQR